jgi:hypothetical protein
MSQIVPDGFITDTIISTDINTGISSEINIQYPPSNPELSTIIPDKPLIPTMNVMYMGFYPVPLLSQYNQYFDWVNSLSNTVIGVGVDGKDITTSAEYYPYVDKFSWKFDEFDIIME